MHDAVYCLPQSGSWTPSPCIFLALLSSPIRCVTRFSGIMTYVIGKTLHPPTASTPASIVGDFSGTCQEIIILHGTRLEVLHVDSQTGKISTMTDVLGSLQSLAAFRLTGGSKGKFSLYACFDNSLMLLHISLL